MLTLIYKSSYKFCGNDKEHYLGHCDPILQESQPPLGQIEGLYCIRLPQRLFKNWYCFPEGLGGFNNRSKANSSI